ncbi:DUF418 domain-containing protein [Nocardia thraciensis]
MTSTKPPQEIPPLPATPPEDAAPGPSTARLVGVDLARALAVFGMYTVHVGPPLSATDGVGSWIRYLAEGHSSVLFATLAGFSLLLIAGRRKPKTGLAGRQAKARIAIRALILIAMGTAMTMAYGDVVILAIYGVFFLLALPLVRLSAKTLALVAAALALVTPQLAFVLRPLLTEPIRQSIDAYDPLEKLSGVGVLDLLLTGMYPTITWMPFVIAGMALARLDLAATAVRVRVAALGAALALLAYGMSRLLGGPDALKSMAESMPGSDALPPAAGSGAFPSQGASSLLLAGPHSGTTFDIVGSVGVALLVIVGALAAMNRLAWLRRLATPLIAVGAMSLTAYVGHFVAMSALSMSAGPGGDHQTSWVPLLVLILAVTVFATLWSRYFRRGPLEYLLNTATKPAKHIR